ncbi:uncharacterized protein LOC133839343 [Drosophila sulfurigaster albostrigata]|uniref:uncharacterized protein LOC133839343 n=1 Tax=Drosophila sulfurigaster albostrigata TaxID=89887 RepID=UPI002D21CA0E|nr:uncharacterized protein LOC133839343 [Drosophila sulfurigaster albostrigata]
MLLSRLVLCVSCCIGLGQAYSLPPAVQLGGVVVAAVEQHAAQEMAVARQRQEREWLEQTAQQLSKLLQNKLSAEQVASFLDTWTAEGRGKHSKKSKKLLKLLYPLLGAAVLAKLILLPLILKWLTALSASSFVMGKIALATSGLLAFKSMLSNTHAHDRVEIVHSSAPTLKSYHSDLSSSGSSWMPMRHPYIPLAITKDAAYRMPPLSTKEVNKPFL